jgi:hypothetical protein
MVKGRPIPSSRLKSGPPKLAENPIRGNPLLATATSATYSKNQPNGIIVICKHCTTNKHSYYSISQFQTYVSKRNILSGFVKRINSELLSILALFIFSNIPSKHAQIPPLKANFRNKQKTLWNYSQNSIPDR